LQGTKFLGRKNSTWRGSQRKYKEGGGKGKKKKRKCGK
jgi:hypothetical protein